MTFLKLLFLFLIIIPFALFLVFILNKLMDDMPTKEEMEAEMSPVERRRNRRRSDVGSRPEPHRQKATNYASKRKRRKERKQQRKQRQS